MSVREWLDDRTEYRAALRHLPDEPLPNGAVWLLTTGSVVLFLLAVQLMTGVVLAMYHVWALRWRVSLIAVLAMTHAVSAHLPNPYGAPIALDPAMKAAAGGDGLRILALPGAIPVEGGVPIVVSGQIVGAIGGFRRYGSTGWTMRTGRCGQREMTAQSDRQ